MNSARKLKHMLCAAAFLLTGGAAHAGLSAEIPTIRPGETTEASVSVSNPAETTAMQFTITLPEGFTIPDGKLTLTHRATGHSTEINAKGDGEYKCVIYSASNAPIEGTSGPLFSFKLQAPASAKSGDYTVLFSGIRYSGQDGKETSDSDVKASVRIFIPVESISLNSTNIDITRGSSTTLTADVMPENATDRSINWTSDNTDVASIDASGKINANGIGTATITATATDGSGVSASCNVTVTPIMVASIKLDHSECNMSIGETVKLTATVSPSDADDSSITWSSNNPDVATVAEDGTVAALAKGSAIITAKANDASGVSASCIVNIGLPAVESVSVNPTEMTLYTRETASVKASVAPSAASQTVIWTCSDTAVATVTAEGTITTISPGQAIVTATASDGSEKSATCSITVLPVLVTSISLDITTRELYVGESVKLKATIKPENAYDKGVTWSSENPEVATVAQDGTVTALTPGNAIITVTASDGSEKSATCQVTVNPILIESISLDKTEMNLTIGESAKLTATIEPENATDKSLTWSSDNPEVATVTQDGTVTAVANGSTIIFVKANDEFEALAICLVNVGLLAAESISVDPSELTLHTGETASLKASVAPATASQTVSWTCSDTAIATVTADGIITALAPGQATVTATTSDGSGKSATCSVTVLPMLVSSISLDITERDLTIGESLTLTATVAPDNAYDKSVTWSSDNIEVATVTADGRVTALANGTAVITAKANDESGVTASCTIHVLLPTPVEIILSQSEVTLEKDSSVQLLASVKPAEASQEVEWMSDDPETASVTQDGFVTALREGETPIWARCKEHPEITTCCMVTVTDDNAVEINTSDNLTIEVERNEITIYGKDANTIVDITDMEGRIIRRTNESVIRGIDHGVYIITIDNFRFKVRI